MRLPFLQVTQETWSRARMLAGLLAISRREAMGLICDLWAWAVDTGPTDQAPTGEVTSPRAPQLMAAALEWPADRAADLIAALVDVGLIAEVDGGYRVRGMDRYRATWERNRADRHAGARSHRGITGDSPVKHRRITGETPVDPRCQTQTQTQTHTQMNTKEEGSRAEKAPLFGSDISAQQNPPAKRVEPKGKTEPKSSAAPGALQEAVLAEFEAARGAPYSWDPRKDDAAVRALLGRVDDTEEITRRWARALRHAGWPAVATLTDLAQHWNRFAGTGPPKPAAASKQRVDAADVDWSKAKEGVFDEL